MTDAFVNRLAHLSTTKLQAPVGYCAVASHRSAGLPERQYMALFCLPKTTSGWVLVLRHSCFITVAHIMLLPSRGLGWFALKQIPSANNKSEFYAAGLYWPLCLNRLRSRGTKLHDSALDVRKCTPNLDRKIFGRGVKFVIDYWRFLSCESLAMWPLSIGRP